MLRQERIILIVSILTGVVAFMLILNYLNSVSQPKHSYVLASVTIPKGRVITSDNLTISAPVPAQQNKDDLFFQIQDVVGFTANEDIPQGDKIRRSTLRREVETQSTDPLKMVYPIPKGMGGVMIQADQVNDIPLQIAPGKYVNIMGYIPDYRGQQQQVTLVFSCMITMIEKPDNGQIKALQVALTPQESETVIGALSRGKLRLVLLQEKEGKPLFLPSFGQIEVIRGTNEQSTNTYGSTRILQKSPVTTANGIPTPQAILGKATEEPVKKTTEKTTP
jgi:Flp pilus assembly protein CpaB